MNVDRRSDSRIRRSALDEVKSIQALLADVYIDAGDGRTLLRELVQNADDAKASKLVFMLLEQGWPEAQNSLLQGPALLVANNGPFPVKDREALHQALGGSKGDDPAKVGRFGIGLKSVFHVCEAIVYVGAEGGVLRPGALNPWAGTGDHGNADPVHPDWDNVDDEDLARLQKVARSLLGAFDDGLVQWIPLRKTAHLDRAKDRPYGLDQACPSLNEVAAWFDRSASLALLLAQCGHLDSIAADRATAPLTLTARTKLAHVTRPRFHPSNWVGRHDNDTQALDRSFQGQIVDERLTWSIVGVERLGLDRLRRLRREPDWPSELHWQDGLSHLVPRKALAHAAITVMHPKDGPEEDCGAHIRWAVFLPLDDDPTPRPSAVVETVGRSTDPKTWDIILHGYFWPSQDRRSIPGVTHDDEGTGDNAVRIRWNQALRDELLLPLLPSALAKAFKEIKEETTRRLLEGIASSQVVEENYSAVTQWQMLLPIVAKEGIRWDTCDAEGHDVLSIPMWTQAPGIVRTRFMDKLNEHDAGVVFIDKNAPKLGTGTGLWPVEWIQHLLDSITAAELRSSPELNWTASLLSHFLGPTPDVEDQRSAVVASWLAKVICEGALVGKTKEEPEAVRSAWKHLFATLPFSWLVNAPVATLQAITELASDGIVGAGLLPIPLGRDLYLDVVSRPNQEQLDRALLALGKRLQNSEKTSKNLRQSRLLLAETLLSIREISPLGEELSLVPLFRAHRFPDNEDDAWSIANLESRSKQHRVFARPRADNQDANSALVVPSDQNQAVNDLAEAVGAEMWLVDGTITGAAVVPPPTTVDLANSVILSEKIDSQPIERVKLLKRLGPTENAIDPIVRSAMVSLMTGQLEAASHEGNLFYVRRQDSEKEANSKSLQILLGLVENSCRTVDAELADHLPPNMVDELNLKAVDFGVLHELLRVCLDESTTWSELAEDERLHLIRRLHSNSPDDLHRWCEMPLHRDVDGVRGRIEDSSLRAVGELLLPPELASEVRLLHPEPELESFYRDIPILNSDGILNTMLASDQPQRFADRILSAIRLRDDNRINLPREPKLLELLRDKSWLPHRADGSGIAPGILVMLPRDLQACVMRLASEGALTEFQLVESVDPEVWKTAEPAVIEILKRPNPSSRIQQLAKALDPATVADVDNGAYVLLPDVDLVDAQLVDDVLQTVLAGSHPGWAIVLAASKAVGMNDLVRLSDATSIARNAVLSVVRKLCGEVPASNQICALKNLAKAHPAKNSSGGRAFSKLINAYSQTDVFFEQVLPHIELPTQNAQWHQANGIAKSASGVGRRHLVLSDLRAPLRLDSSGSVHTEALSNISIGAGTVDALTSYFEPWSDRLPNGAVAAFLGLLGNGKDNAILDLSQRWLGSDVTVEGMRNSLDHGAERDPCGSVRVSVSGKVAQGQHVKAMNLLGQWVEMEAAANENNVFAFDPVRSSSRLGDFWQITLRDVDPNDRTGNELVAALGDAVEWWAVRVLQLDRNVVRSWWAHWGTGSQAQVGPVQASILAHLPLTLHQLDIHENELLADALRDAQSAQRRREQAPDGQLREAIDNERSKLGSLASLIRDDPEHQRYIWERVRAMMERFGYREDSVLLELVQNADDALSQSAEIDGCSLPEAARKLIVRVAKSDSVPTVDIIHYGRPINDTGGAAFPAGRDRQWDQDLYFMMLLNLSGKPGEVPGQNSVASTTGRFGLGFKSIHLVSETPSVVSGFLAFSIAGGLLPLERSIPDDPDLRPAEGQRATRVRLPLRGDVDPRALIDKMFQRFNYARALLPAFAREICEIVVDGGAYAGISAFRGEPVDGAPGWSISQASVELPGHGLLRLLRFRPADVGDSRGTAALVVGLKDGTPDQFPSDLPFLWNVTPTSEGWGCGYAVNGPFKLDPGRTHVSLDDEATLRVADLLGEALGKGLADLHDALVKKSVEATDGLPVGESANDFLASLWYVLSSGLDNRDDLRRDFIHRIQGHGRGISMWMGVKSVVPSGLTPPFSDRLPALEEDIRIEVAAGGLENPLLRHALAQIDDLATLAQSHVTVSSDVADRLRPLLDIALRPFRSHSLLQELAERWDHVLTSERLQALKPLSKESVWALIPSEPQESSWSSKLVASSVEGRKLPLRQLLIPRGVSFDGSEASFKDELLRAAFAPDELVLDPEYISGPEDLTMFARLRVRHQIDAATMASWYFGLSDDLHPAALRYLLDGGLRNEILDILIRRDTRPCWLENYDQICIILNQLSEDRWRSNALLAALFPDQFQHVPDPDLAGEILSETVKRNFFEHLEEWWDDQNVRDNVIESYENRTWPEWLRRDGIADGLRTNSEKHWLGLFVLGACRSIGRAQPGHHRSFLESAERNGWWDVFMKPDDTAAWMNMLRSWQDSAVADLDFSRWMSLFPAIYQLSRYLKKYRRLMLSAGQREESLYRVTCLLAPRVDEALIGAGQNFDAPPAPLNMGLHWALRELVRLGILDGDHIFPDCWVPSEQVLRFLRPLGMESPNSSASNSEKASEVFDFLASELNTATPHLHRSFDIPLLHIDGNTNLRRQLGLEEE
jgi:hypothetical protein